MNSSSFQIEQEYTMGHLYKMLSMLYRLHENILFHVHHLL